MSRLCNLQVYSLIVVVLCLFTGCASKTYSLRLVPDGESIQRTLTVEILPRDAGSDDGKSPVSVEELAHLREFYDLKQEQVKDGLHTFVGTFSGTMPTDVGGAGEYVFFESPLGSTSLYSERFRGEDDLQRNMQDRNAAIDEVIELLLNWSREEFAGQPIQSRIEKLLDQDIRHDLKNLSIYCWTHVMVHDLGDDAVGQRFTARVGQYLIERNYFSLTNLPNVVRVFRSEDGQAMVDLLHDTVIRKLQVGDDKSAVASLAILDDAERLASSLRESIRKSEIYRTELAKYKTKHHLEDGAEVKDDAFDPLGLLFERALQAMLPNAFATTRVNVKLQSNVKPFATNATWNAEDRTVEWSEQIADGDIPALVFAAWSTPDEGAQKQRFGDTILAGESLAQFVYWYRGLTDEQRQRIDMFLNTLTPGGDMVEKIDEFRFADDTVLPDVLTKLLKQAIKEGR